MAAQIKSLHAKSSRPVPFFTLAAEGKKSTAVYSIRGIALI
jgi:hypothetical protein